MRDLAFSEFSFICGGESAPSCPAPTTVSVGVGPVTGSVTTSDGGQSLGQIAINAYEAAVEFTSHIIERVAEAF